jgi:hypothetical protein
MARRLKKRCEESPILHPGCRRIDIGASDLFVAVSDDCDPQPVRSFPTFYSRSEWHLRTGYSSAEFAQ